jgi:hypothetical protein
MEKRSFHFGFSTILITFVMLCIVTFCALALLTANSDYKLSRKVAEKTSAYYEAEESAYGTLEALDTELAGVYRETFSKDDYMANARTVLAQYAADHTDDNMITTDDDELAVAWEIPYSDTQTLSVALTVSYPPENGGTCYTLTAWKTVSNVPESDTQTLDLIGKEITYER